MEFIGIFFWLFFLFGTSFILGSFWSLVFTGKKYHLFVLPGVIVHEFSHVIGCLITGAGIKKIGILSSKGSYVAHTKSRIPLIGIFIISLAPIAGGLLSLFLLFRFFNYPQPEMNLFLGFDSFFLLIKQALNFSLNYYSNWHFWLFSYIALSIVICLVPSKQDFKNSLVSLIVLSILILLFLYFGIFSEKIILFLNYYLVGALGMGVFFGLIAFLASIPFYLIKKIFF